MDSIFDKYIDDVLDVLASGEFEEQVTSSIFDAESTWPKGRPGDIVLNADTAIELGHPQTESLAFLMWTDSRNKVRDGRITVYGPDLKQMAHGKTPFGKVTLIAVHGFTEDNSYERFQEMDMTRIRLSLKGHMIRAVPQQNKEWSRISKQAMKEGFSLRTLGNELIREYRKLEYVDAVEVMFVTSSIENVQKLRPAGEKVFRIISAMNKIFDNVDLDCSSCEFSDVCDEVEGLRSMHKKAH